MRGYKRSIESAERLLQMRKNEEWKMKLMIQLIWGRVEGTDECATKRTESQSKKPISEGGKNRYFRGERDCARGQDQGR